MKKKLFLSLSIASGSVALALSAAPAAAQQIYRCVSGAGVSEYINNAKEAQARSCKPMTGGNVTVVQGTANAGGSAARPAVRASSSLSPAPQRSDGSSEQRARDSDSRVILEAELKKSESRLADLQKEYKDGEPDKQGIEGRNYQRYLDRVAELKENISRSQSDIAGIKREIARLPSQN
jgi:hypothetical protein